MGRKRLYVFDKTGECHEMIPLCVLDFYVHESRQRMGCGKKLFEYMLNVCLIIITNICSLCSDMFPRSTDQKITTYSCEKN